MSALEEYEDSMLGPNPFCHKRLVDAAIAELKTELANKTTSRDLYREKCVRLRFALNKAEAERDEWKLCAESEHDASRFRNLRAERVEAERDAMKCCGNCDRDPAANDECDDCMADNSHWQPRAGADR